MWDGVVKWFRGDQDDSVVGEDTDADRPSSDVDRIALTNQRYDSTVDTSDTGRRRGFADIGAVKL